MKVIARLFKSLARLPCWGLVVGGATSLRLEFGEPHLVIREPIEPRPGVPPRARAVLRRRNVRPVGEWHLWIYECHWKVLDRGRPRGNSTSRRSMQRAASFLQGQKLTGIEIAPRSARTAFRFDLGAELIVWPIEKLSEMWMLFTPTGRLLMLRADRQYAYDKATKPVKRLVWRRLD